MNYEIRAIETAYNGINFRSRLEARWAAMFDLLKWNWTYEPIDFDGWIPDFAIHGEHVVYVEVKPVAEFPMDVADKIDASGCPNEVLIVGMLGPMPEGSEWFDQTFIGWLREAYPDANDINNVDFSWSKAPMGRWIGSERMGSCQKKDIIGFCHEEGSFTDRITGRYDGGGYGNGGLRSHEVILLWREACNRTRWNAKK
jgi:hypothetical protein